MPRIITQLLIALLLVALAGSAIASKTRASKSSKAPQKLLRYVSVVRFDQGTDVKFVFDSYNTVKVECAKNPNVTRVYSGIDMGLNKDDGNLTRNFGVIFVMDFVNETGALEYMICMRDSPLMPASVKKIGHLANCAGYTTSSSDFFPTGKEIMEFYLYNYTTDYTIANPMVKAAVESSVKGAKKYMLSKPAEEHSASFNQLTAPFYFHATGYYGFAAFKNVGHFKKYNASISANKDLKGAISNIIVPGVGTGRMQYKPYIIKK